MKDYRVTVKVRNNRILKAIAEVGGTPGQKWCHDNGLLYSQVNALINLTMSPLQDSGELRLAAAKLCEVLGKLPDELWTSEQINRLERNFAELEMSYEQVMSLLPADKDAHYLMDESIEREQLDDAIAATLEALPENYCKVLRLRYYENKTLEEIACMMDLSRERIRQLEAKALRLLRHPARLGLLVDALPDATLGKTHEKIIREEVKKTQDLAEKDPDYRNIQTEMVESMRRKWRENNA